MEVNFKKEDKILVVTPHQDDESIGCGGLLALYGEQCDVLLLTDGSLGNIEQYNDTDKLISIRNSEFEKATKIAKVNNTYSLGIKNNELYKNKDVVRKFDISSYDYIFVPNRHEEQDDHKVVYSIIKSMKHKGKIYEYEVWTPLARPSWFLDISKVIKTKEKMISQYKSQLANKNYLDATIGLNKYRGLYNNYEYAEAYAYSNYNEFTEKVYNLMPEFIKNIIKKIIK